MKTVDLGYVAGIIDGEGAIGTKRNLPKLSVKSTDLDIVEKCLKVTGVGNIYGPYTRKDRPTNKPIWCWDVKRQSECASVLMTVYPLVCDRRKNKIEEVLRLWREKPLPYSAPCGTQAGYYKHRRHGEPSCAKCKIARLEYDRNRRKSLQEVGA